MTSEQDLIYLEPLTHREKEILQLLASGSSNHEIATKLFLEVSTVKWHNAQIYDKLRVKNRKEAIIRAQTLGILEANSSGRFLQILHNLPTDTLPFIGRAEEIQELVKQLSSDKYRLITILGPGGMGKTRLAIEVGRYLIAHFIDGVYFVPLAAVTTSEQIITTIAAIVGFKFHNGEQIHKQLFEHLHQQQLLLIIDNFEHLLASGDLLTDILHHAPKIRILVTSREKLNVIGETIHFLNGLAVPVDERLESITRSDAVRLFMETAHRTGAIVSDKEMVIASRICQLLGGMPLGILLAAAWTDTLSLAEIETELRAGLSILEADLRDVPARHHSIKAVFDYSWRRLTADEQNGFMFLSVFRGGFTREAAQRSAGISLRNLQRLVHTSFIQHQPSGRYTLHELLRQYGEQKLTVSGNYDKLRENHALYFAEFMTPLGSVGWEQATPDMLETVKADFENVRTAWIFQAERKNIYELRRFLDGVWLFLDLYSRSQEGVDLFELLLQLTTSQGEIANDKTLFRGQVLARLSWFYNDIGRGKEAIAFAEEAIPIVQKYDATNDILLAYLGLSIMLRFAYREDESRELIEKGYDLCLKTGDTKWRGLFLYYKGVIHLESGEYQKALEWTQARPNHVGSAHKYEVLGRVLTHLGDYDKAEDYLFKAISSQPSFHRYANSTAYCYLIENAFLAENHERAWIFVQRALQFVNDNAYGWAALEVFGYVLPLLIAENQYETAVEVLSLIMGHRATMERTRTMVTKHQEVLKTILPIDEFEAAWEHGKQLDLGDVITEYMER